MADDIVTRLRVNAEGAWIQDGSRVWLSLSPSTSAEAADLIEAQQADIERLHAAGDALCAALRLWIEDTPFDIDVRAIRAWEEARRG